MRIRKQIIVPLAACALALAPAIATARPHHAPVCRHGYKHPLVKKRVHRHGQWIVVRNRGKVVYIKSAKCVKPKPKIKHIPKAKPPAFHPAALPTRAPVIAVGNIPGVIHGDASQIVPYMSEYGANVMRVILPEYRSDLDPLPAIISADEHGYRVQLSIQWNNDDSPAQVATFFQQTLARYGPYVWAVVIGNEQELWFDHGASKVGLTPAQYAADWQAAEPVVAAMAPRALRVAGDITAGALSWMQQAWALGLPGAQALGWHGYNALGGNTPAQVIAWTDSVGITTWVDEGLSGRDAWPGGNGDQPASAFAGAALVGAWIG